MELGTLNSENVLAINDEITAYGYIALECNLNDYMWYQIFCNMNDFLVWHDVILDLEPVDISLIERNLVGTLTIQVAEPVIKIAGRMKRNLARLGVGLNDWENELTRQRGDETVRELDKAERLLIRMCK